MIRGGAGNKLSVRRGIIFTTITQMSNGLLTDEQRNAMLRSIADDVEETRALAETARNDSSANVTLNIVTAGVIVILILVLIYIAYIGNQTRRRLESEVADAKQSVIARGAETAGSLLSIIANYMSEKKTTKK